MKSEKAEPRKQKRNYRTFSAEEKCRAVLSVWSERRSAAETCRELAIDRDQFKKWQDLALQGILNALEVKKDHTRCSPLGERLAKLLERKVSARTQPKRVNTAESRPLKPEENAVQKGE